MLDQNICFCSSNKWQVRPPYGVTHHFIEVLYPLSYVTDHLWLLVCFFSLLFFSPFFLSPIFPLYAWNYVLDIPCSVFWLKSLFNN